MLTRFVCSLHSFRTSLNVDFLKREKIDHLVCIGPAPTHHKSHGLKMLKIQVNDEKAGSYSYHLPKVCGFINTAIEGGGRVLVHCINGLKQSPTFAVAYVSNFDCHQAHQALKFAL